MNVPTMDPITRTRMCQALDGLFFFRLEPF